MAKIGEFATVRQAFPGPLGGERPVDPVAALRSQLEPGKEAVIVPGVVDALGGMLVERAGFQACYLTGAGIANTQLGTPDIGLVTMNETVEQARRISDAVNIPVIVDADAGHGGPLGVMRTVNLLRSAGAAAIQIEDQEMPKRCGHFDGKRIVEAEEMESKIRAAVRARRGDDPMIIARTDARAIEGLDAAIERAKRYRDAGADVLFVEAPETEDELVEIPRSLPDVPLLVNIVEGGRTPEHSAEELAAMGYRIVLHANMLMRVMAKAGIEALEYLAEHGETRGLTARMLRWDERQELVGLDVYDDLEDELRTADGRR